MTKGIDYGQLMQKALLRMIAGVLTRVARDGLPGEHYFFITFDTGHPGVDMAASLRERFPGQMTIVLQEFFENLAVMNDRFTVTLNFGGVLEPIVIPFDAIKTFADPSVEFGLRFDEHDHDALTFDDDEPELDDRRPAAEPTQVGFDARRAEARSRTEAKVAAPETGGDVVSIDKFRKT